MLRMNVFMSTTGPITVEKLKTMQKGITNTINVAMRRVFL